MQPVSDETKAQHIAARDQRDSEIAARLQVAARLQLQKQVADMDRQLAALRARAASTASAASLSHDRRAMPAVELPDELWALVGGFLSPGHDRPGPPGRLRALRVLHRKSVLHVVFVWARQALNGPAWRFPARAVVRTLGRLARTAR